MGILLPKCETTIVSSDLAECKFDNTMVSVTIPKFTYETSNNFNDELISSGVTDMFDKDKCNVLGMSGIYVNSVIQKVKITVTETGTEASASTAITTKKTSVNTKQVYFTADRPFIFYIKYGNDILFVCKYS